MKRVASIGVLILASLAISASGQGPAGAAKKESIEKKTTDKKESVQATASAQNTPVAGASEITEDSKSSKQNAETSTSNGSSLSTSASGGTVSEEPSLTTIYRVGTGDVLDIRLPNLAISSSTLFTVLEGGFIEVPVAGGQVLVSGLTTDEIQTRIAAELKRRALQDNPRVTVGVRQYASHTVIINGLVASPGTRILRREAVPLYVILAETQLRLDAARATIMRSGAPALMVDLSDPSYSDVLIRPGDVVNVTARPEQFYYIAGRINYPGQKTFQRGITLLQSILAAGGARGGEDIVEISREGADGKLTTTKYSLKEIKSGKTPDPRLQPGDRIEVVR